MPLLCLATHTLCPYLPHPFYHCTHTHTHLLHLPFYVLHRYTLLTPCLVSPLRIPATTHYRRRAYHLRRVIARAHTGSATRHLGLCAPTVLSAVLSCHRLHSPALPPLPPRTLHFTHTPHVGYADRSTPRCLQYTHAPHLFYYAALPRFCHHAFAAAAYYLPHHTLPATRSFTVHHCTCLPCSVLLYALHILCDATQKDRCIMRSAVRYHCITFTTRVLYLLRTHLYVHRFTTYHHHRTPAPCGLWFPYLCDATRIWCLRIPLHFCNAPTTWFFVRATYHYLILRSLLVLSCARITLLHAFAFGTRLVLCARSVGSRTRSFTRHRVIPFALVLHLLYRICGSCARATTRFSSLCIPHPHIYLIPATIPFRYALPLRARSATLVQRIPHVPLFTDGTWVYYALPAHGFLLVTFLTVRLLRILPLPPPRPTYLHLRHLPPDSPSAVLLPPFYYGFLPATTERLAALPPPPPARAHTHLPPPFHHTACTRSLLLPALPRGWVTHTAYTTPPRAYTPPATHQFAFGSATAALRRYTRTCRRRFTGSATLLPACRYVLRPMPPYSPHARTRGPAVRTCARAPLLLLPAACYRIIGSLPWCGSPLLPPFARSRRARLATFAVAVLWFVHAARTHTGSFRFFCTCCAHTVQIYAFWFTVYALHHCLPLPPAHWFRAAFLRSPYGLFVRSLATARNTNCTIFPAHTRAFRVRFYLRAHHHRFLRALYHYYYHPRQLYAHLLVLPATVLHSSGPHRATRFAIPVLAYYCAMVTYLLCSSYCCT